MIKEINILEVASELATSRLKQEIEEMYVEDENGDLRFDDQAQDIFNEYYAYYENLLNNI